MRIDFFIYLKRNLLLFFFFLCVFLRQAMGQTSYGLTFSSHEVIPEQRTSLDLSDSGPFCFDSQLQLSFDIRFIPNLITYFGYVFRLINEDNQNIDLLYDQHKLSFRLINQETFTNIDFSIDQGRLSQDWTRVQFTFDPKKGIYCTVQGKTFHASSPGLKGRCLKIIFGVSNEHNFISSDLPPMQLKDIVVTADRGQRYSWPLNQSAGSMIRDDISNKQAKVLNPGWIKPRHNNWQLIRSLTIDGTPSIAFNSNQEELYLVSTDSFYTLSPGNAGFSAHRQYPPHANLLPGNQSIYNNYSGKLYNFYIDQEMVTGYDSGSGYWSRSFKAGPPTEYWQVNKFFADDSSLFVLCGYGQLKYKNTIRRINPLTNEWGTILPDGDSLAPRYLAALGSTAGGDTAYILGGFGSKAGDQLLNPRHFYDLLVYDVRRNRLKKIYTLPEPQEQFVFANSLIIDSANSNYYALIFPNSRFNTSLQLIKGSLKTPSYQLMGLPFSYSFKDVKSFADLFFCRRSNQLLAVTLYTTPDQKTEVKIYTIGFPPNTINEAMTEAGKKENGLNSSKGYLLTALLLLVLTGSFLLVRARKKRNRQRNQAGSIPAESKNGKAEVTPLSEATPAQENTGMNEADIAAGLPHAAASSLPDNGYEPVPDCRVLLFGTFEVISADGKNITKQFTPLLKELFLLILIYSIRYKKGVSAEKLNEVLWNDKDIKDATNNRSVNLVKLKSILDKLGGATVSRQTGAWILGYDPAKLTIDLADYLSLLNNTTLSTRQKAAGVMRIARNGSFLTETPYEWLDEIKAEISNQIIELLGKYAEELSPQSEPEKIIEACDTIFHFDELNENALKLKCRSLVVLGRHTLAAVTFNKFAGKYKEIYGEEYGQSYNGILSR